MVAGRAGLVVAALLVSGDASAQDAPTVTDPSKTIYVNGAPRAPRELDVFAFLIGKWDAGQDHASRWEGGRY